MLHFPAKVCTLAPEKNRCQSLVPAKISSRCQFPHRGTMKGKNNNLKSWRISACWLEISHPAAFAEIKTLCFHVGFETSSRALILRLFLFLHSDTAKHLHHGSAHRTTLVTPPVTGAATGGTSHYQGKEPEKTCIRTGSGAAGNVSICARAAVKKKIMIRK